MGSKDRRAGVRRGRLGFGSPALIVTIAAALGCGGGSGGGAPVPGDDGDTGGSTQTVQIVNSRGETIHVTCSMGTTAATGPCALTWGTGCTAAGSGSLGIYATVASGSTCQVEVDPSTGPSRLCASDDASDIPDCWQAQWNHVTLLETNFTSTEVFYDLSVIPLNFGKPGCTDQQWQTDYCNASGQASYNLPLSAGCSTDAATDFTCQGPPSSQWGTENMYPGNCGNPPQNPEDPSLCVCGQCGPPCNVDAFFYPMAELPQGTKTPVRSCAIGGNLVATVLAGS